MAFKPDKRLSKLYQKYNEKYFDGTLPECHVGWSEKLKETDTVGLSLVMQDGDIKIHGIALDEDIKHFLIPVCLKGVQVFYKTVMLHEMVHIKLYPYMHHGKRFYEEITRLVLRGAYVDLL